MKNAVLNSDINQSAGSRKGRQGLWLSLFLAAAAFVLMLPLFLGGPRNGYDTLFHVANVDKLFEQLQQNPLFPSRVVGGAANDFGYGTYLFYPPLSHFTAAYLNFFTRDTILSIQITHFLFLALSGMTMFWASARISGSRRVGFMSGLVFMLFPYHLTNIYVRDAFSECALFVFLPLILWGLYELFDGDKAKFYPLFVIGYAGGMLSHLSLMIPFTLLVFLYLLLRVKETIKTCRLLPLCLAGLFVLLLTSPFWINVLTYKLQGGYTVFEGSTMYEGIEGYGLTFSQYDVLWKRDIVEMRYYISLPVMAMLLVTLFNIRKFSRKYYPVLFLGVLAFCMTTLYWPWKYMPDMLKMVQFPSRFQIFMFLALALFTPLCLTLLSHKQAHLLLPLLAVFILLSGFQHVGVRAETVDLAHFDYNNGMGWQKEYLPVAAAQHSDYWQNRSHEILVRSGSAEVQIEDDRLPALRFQVESPVNAVLELPRLYYLGYQLKNEQGKTIALYQNENGFLEAAIPAPGVYTLNFAGTPAERTARVLSLVSILLFAAFIGFRRKYVHKHCHSLL